ncbi:MAG: xanthine dehydrogenase family protein subunit M [Thermodesulfobacteriota bacterium]|nr:xanthine dehydrogenase family protein subunit M [Thermodesulfobacteriota bacterium]
MRNFDYFKPGKITDACSLLSKYGEKAKIIAGGQSLLILMKEKIVCPSCLVDITEIPNLDYIQYDNKGGLRIGALTTHREIESSSLIKERFNVLSEVEKAIASIQIRNVGTIGGNLCHGDPCGDLAPLLIGLEAQVKLTGFESERLVPLEDFFTDYYETVLKEDEILAEIQIPSLLLSGGQWYSKCSPRETDPAIVGVAVVASLESPDGICRKIRIVIGGAGPVPLRSKKAEKRIEGNRLDEKLIEEAAKIVKEEVAPVSDIRGTEEYKREMVELLTKEGITGALEKVKK